MNDFYGIAALAAVIVVYIGEKVQQYLLTSVLREALKQAQAQINSLNSIKAAPPIVVTQPALPQPPVPQLPAPSPAPAPSPVPTISGPFAGAPAWFQWALHEIGFHEQGDNRGLDRYIALAHTGANGEPWCAIFANAALEATGVMGSRSASSQSFRSNPNFVQLEKPALGAIAVFWRGSPSSGLGHVGFYRGENANRVWTLGGNEHDMVQIEALPKSTSGFGLVGYWWPKAVPLPSGGPVMMPTGSALSITHDPSAASVASDASAHVKSGVQENITATVFGDDGHNAAYGFRLDNTSPGVALPFRFSGTRPRVRVSNAHTGASVDCDIVDVGPWNTHDPYWQTGTRPQAETGTDLGQVSAPRHTNGAGIDLTPAAAAAIQIDGKGLVNWSFIDSPAIKVE